MLTASLAPWKRKGGAHPGDEALISKQEGVVTGKETKMLPIKVALVSKTVEVRFEDTTRVAAALTMQVSRDVTPIWGIQATVRAFPDVRQVPAGYWPIFVVTNLPPDEGGFHWTRHKQPYAEVEAGDTWSLSASHELIEMLVDPSGSRLVAGPELVLTNGSIGDNPQKQVEYLIEACDPCESGDFAYLIEDVVVSDFFTPHYHDPVVSPGTRYSFTGALTHPRHVLPGGYISWADPATGDLMQVQYFGGTPKIVNRSHGAASGDMSLREFVHKGIKEFPPLSKMPASHRLQKLRSEKRDAIYRAAESKSKQYPH